MVTPPVDDVLHALAETTKRETGRDRLGGVDGEGGLALRSRPEGESRIEMVTLDVTGRDLDQASVARRDLFTCLLYTSRCV